MESQDLLFKSNVKPDSVLSVLQKSLESLQSLRRDRSSSPCRLKFSISPCNPLIKKPLQVIKNRETTTASTSSNFSPAKLIRSSQASRNNLFSMPRTNSSESKRVLPCKPIGIGRTVDLLKEIKRKIDFDQEDAEITKCDLINKAREELSSLTRNQESIHQKVGKINESLTKLSSAHVEEQNAMLSIINKLDILETIAEKEHEAKIEKVSNVIEKVSKLETNYSYLRHHGTDSLKNFKEEMKEVNYKLQDLKESGEILKELVICLGKEPIVVSKSVQNAETFMDDEVTVKEEFVVLDRLDPENVLNDLMQQKESMVREKERMESEYRTIPQNSKSMTNKRRKQALELELSMNYTKLMALNSKIKKYAN